MAGWLTARDVNFISLQSAVFCAECELISQNNTRSCLACGSQALLSLSRVMGGSLLDQSTANLIQDAALDRLVRELLQTVPTPAPLSHPASHVSEHLPAHRHHLRTISASAVTGPEAWPLGLEECSAFDLDLEPAISLIADRAQVMTGATGAAIALRRGDEIVCRARAGRTAPDLGVRLQTQSGISGQCVRSGEVLLCHDTESDPQVDIASSRRLGVRSILVAPLRHFRRTLGIFEVLSAAPYAFDHRDVATLQLLSGMMVAAISRIAGRKPAQS
jgi:GAF domain-containing protein